MGFLAIRIFSFYADFQEPELLRTPMSRDIDTLTFAQNLRPNP